ncbi:protein CMSS1 isoform X1 [Hippoglossus hippoglossus]|uniref:protein CMSS1 n=1 Tax=Hippoglossus stenolepis TaxID=195615 RepID=UPI00148E61B6|nr:protein CMSS1 isoform X1 [Hippoglossus hippoglossus]XP_035030338.1 protein CMSS1 [Hippoglossus stenolepis]
MGDDLGDEWWQHEDASEAEQEEETEQEKPPTDKTITKTKPEKRKKITETTDEAKKKKKSEESECVIPQKKETEDEKSTKPKKKRKKKKKTITDVLATSEPKPGCAADLQSTVSLYFSDKRSVIEQEELNLQDSGFLSCNDLTHTLSSYLKLVCPKWAKIQKQHTEKSSVILLIVCSSALRAIELIKQLTTFKGETKAMKLFAKHIKIEEQVNLLQKGVTHIGVGTPGRISALIQKDGLTLKSLRYMVLDWNWRDQKLRRMVDIPEIKLDFMKLLEGGILTGCREGKLKIGLF